MPTKPTMFTISTIVTKATTQARRHGGHFVALPPPKITACAPQARNVPPSEDGAPKESNKRSTTGHFETVPPQYTACFPQK